MIRYTSRRRKMMMLFFSSEVPALLVTLQARATYYENVACTTVTLTELENIV